MSPPSSVSSVTFVKELKVFLTEEQDSFLQTEVQRRKGTGETSSHPAARGGNRHVNKGMLIREALMVHFKIATHEKG